MEKINKYLNHRAIVVLYLFILSIVFFKTYDRIFDKKVHLGGDNADYYIYGKSLANGHGYSAIHTKAQQPANHFPPGYPAMIAVTMKLFSAKITTIKKANGFYMLAALFVLFFLFRALTRNIHLSFVACLFTLFNYHLLEYSTIMYSEIPFVLVATITLLLFIYIDFEKPIWKNWKFFLFILTMVLAFYIRTLGVSLVISFTLILLFQKRWKYAGVLVFGFILLIAPWQIRSHKMGGNSYVNQLLMKNPYRPELGPMTLKDWPERFTMNVKRYLALEITSGILPFETIDYKQTVAQLQTEVPVDPAAPADTTKKEPVKVLTLEEKQQSAASRGMPGAKVEITVYDFLLTFVLFLLMAIGLFRLKDHRVLIGLYIAGTFSILFLWPEAWFGIRFMLPLVPILIFLSLNGLVQIPEMVAEKMKWANPWLLVLIIPFFTFFVLKNKLEKRVVELENRAKGVYVNQFKNYFDVATWASKNLPKDAVVATRKGQLFYLYANRYVDGFLNTLDKEELIKSMHDKGVTHVVLDQLGYSSTSRYLYPAIQKYPGKFNVIHQVKNPDTYLMEFHYDLDYTGDWVDGKKQGKGTFKWVNGMSYEGDWVNNRRNGYGIFSWPNKQRFEGEWKDDVRHGPGVLHMPDGTKMEGVWTNDVLNGKVRLFNAQGVFVETANFANNQRLK